jgi:hypothetical protein
MYVALREGFRVMKAIRKQASAPAGHFSLRSLSTIVGISIAVGCTAAMTGLPATARAQSADVRHATPSSGEISEQAPTEPPLLPSTVDAPRQGGSTSENSEPAPAFRPLRAIAAAMARSAGVMVLADSTVCTRSVVAPRTATTLATLPAQLNALVQTLPAGSVWAMVYLPVPGAGPLDADAVSDYLTGQARLYGTAGAATDGKVEIMGQRLSPERAAPVIAALNLRPVYLITNPRARGGSDAANFAQMTPEERSQYAQQQAASILNVDPSAGAQYIDQQSQIMQALMQQMTPE